MKFFVALSVLVTVVHSGVVVQDNQTVLKSVIENFVNCANSDLSLCIQEKALLVSERIGTLRQLKLTDEITIVNNAPERILTAEPLSTDLEVRRKQISERLSERAAKFLENSELEVTFNPSAEEDDDEGRDIGEARGDKKKKKKAAKKKIKMLLPLLHILKAKIALLVVGAVLIAALSAVKLVILAKIAFVVKAFLIIKALISKHKGQEEWVHHEEVHHDHHDHHGHHDFHDHHGHHDLHDHHGHHDLHDHDNHYDNHGWEDSGHGGGWGRSGKDTNDLAYSAYNKNTIS